MDAMEKGSERQREIERDLQSEIGIDRGADDHVIHMYINQSTTS